MKQTKIIFSLFVFVAFCGSGDGVVAQKRKPTARREIVVRSPAAVGIVAQKLSPELQRRVDAFNFAWQTIKNNYFDQTFSGLDWDKIKREYEPRVLKTQTDAQLHDLLQEMINRLNRSHFAVIPPEVYQAIETAKVEAKAREKQKAAEKAETSPDEEAADEEENSDSTDYAAKFGIGVDLRLIDKQFVVTRVEKNSTAEKAGLKIGYVVEKINGVSLVELLGRLEIYYAEIRSIKRYLPKQITEFMLNGAPDSFVALTCLTETEQSKEISVRREALKGATVVIGKNLPEQFMKFESAALGDEVGLIRFNMFALPVIEKFCAALTELKDKKAIIIDLRGNTGGVLGSMVGLSGMLTEKSIDLGTSVYKVGSENLIGSSKAKNYKGRLIFLVDNQTVSAAEIFAAALQENNRALIVGEKTAGEALPSVSVQLPTGAVLMYPIANFKTRNGNFLEGRGVEPNFIVALDRKTLLNGKDAQLEAALRLIKDDNAFPKPPEPFVIAGRGNAVPPPPPPPPIAVKSPAPQGKVLGEVTIKTANSAPPKEVVNRKDGKALQVIKDFTDRIGGAAAFDKINSYSLKGTAELNARGTKVKLDISIYRQKPDRYAEIMNSDPTGEIRQVYNNKKTFVQADYGADQETSFDANTNDVEIFAPLKSMLRQDSFKSLAYQGAFDREGRKVHLIEAVTEDDFTVALAFDVETKFLVSYTGLYFGINFGDYRAVGGITLPFRIERENLMNIELDEIKLNPAIAESVFVRKENCFDKAN